MGQVRLENLLSELDAPEEWYYDASTATLYFAYNATDGMTPPPPDVKFGAVTLQNLLQINGDGAGPAGPPTRPAANISVLGIGFRVRQQQRQRQQQRRQQSITQ